MQSIEIRDARTVSDPRLIRAALQRIYRAGLEATVHLWLPQRRSAAEELPPGIRATDEELRRHGVVEATSPCAIHGHSRSGFASDPEAMDATVQNLVALCRTLLAQGATLAPCFELCRRKEGSNVGSTFEEVCEVVEEVSAREKNAALGICYDLGHALSNARVHDEPLHPPAGFLGRVRHTHIHDLDRHGRTHAPLLEETSQIAGAIRRLRDQGYDGIYDLELEPTRWQASAAESRSAVEGSVDTLQRILG